MFSCRDGMRLPGMLVIPRDFDIILGRGSACAKHPGNVTFTRLIEAYASQYGTMSSRMGKSLLIHSIYENVLPFGQFLRDDAASGRCVVVDSHVAKNKIGHALRYRYKQNMETNRLAAQSSDGPRRRAIACNKDLFSDEELESVLGYPGQFDYPPPGEIIESLTSTFE